MGSISVDARPGPFMFDPSKTAVIVIDMQNDFGAEKGMFACAGIPIDAIQSAVVPTARVLAAARPAGIKVVYLKMQFEPDLSDAGGPEAPNRVRHLRIGVGSGVDAPDGSESRILIRDTWNTAILPALEPEDGDLVVPKHRFSGFFETNLDELLKEHGIETLVFTGCTTSVCVESTVRDAFFRDYRLVVLEDCTAEPMGTHESTLRLVERFFGWVSDSSAFVEALGDGYWASALSGAAGTSAQRRS